MCILYCSIAFNEITKQRSAVNGETWLLKQEQTEAVGQGQSFVLTCWDC